MRRRICHYTGTKKQKNELKNKIKSLQNKNDMLQSELGTTKTRLREYQYRVIEEMRRVYQTAFLRPDEPSTFFLSCTEPVDATCTIEQKPLSGEERVMNYQWPQGLINRIDSKATLEWFIDAVANDIREQWAKR